MQSVTERPADEAQASRDADGHHSRRWAIWHHQFDLVRALDGEVYLRRWWIVKTPWGGIALHRMTAGDARPTLHDHPFPFVSIVLRGGYIERRLHPRTMTINEHRRVRRVNVMPRYGAHSIRSLLRSPTWTLLFIGRHRRKWGFLEPDELAERDGELQPISWVWVQHDAYDSGHYAS